MLWVKAIKIGKNLMQEIQPSLTGEDIVCAENPAQASGIVVFGASGDLTHRKLLVSLTELFSHGLLGERFYLLGAGRKKLSDEQFRNGAKEAIKNSLGDISAKQLQLFTNKLYYITGNYNDPSLY